jgi:esterase/lipase superfamily enzyme
MFSELSPQGAGRQILCQSWCLESQILRFWHGTQFADILSMRQKFISLTAQTWLPSIISTCLMVFVYQAQAVDSEISQRQTAQRLHCQAAVGSDTGQSLVCFRDDVLDAGLATETRGCSVRLYDLESKQFVGYRNGEKQDPKQVLLVPQKCKEGGFESILKWPIDETTTLETYLRSAYSRVSQVYDLSKDQTNVISQLIRDINAENARLSQEPVKESTSPRGGSVRAAAPMARELPTNSKHATVRVFFGTDRKFIPGHPPAETFSNDRAPKEQVTLGITDVSIPANHKFGNLELPSVFNIQMTPDPDHYVVVKSIARLDARSFQQLLARRVEKSPRKDLFVFVHGYNTSFEEAAQRTAQMAFDLKFPGAPVFYSWPAETLLRYAIAEKNVEWSLPHLIHFLREISQKSGALEIHLIAHSMGNRALTNALNALALQKSVKPQFFQNVILAAADVDQLLFAQIQNRIRSLTKNMTLYASNNDKALQISARIHKVARLGQAGAHTFIAPGMDTVDASAVDSSFLGHSYYGDNPSVVDDIEKLVMFSLPVSQRSLEAKLTSSGETFWQIPDPLPMLWTPPPESGP